MESSTRDDYSKVRRHKKSKDRRRNSKSSTPSKRHTRSHSPSRSRSRSPSKERKRHRRSRSCSSESDRKYRKRSRSRQSSKHRRRDRDEKKSKKHKKEKRRNKEDEAHGQQRATGASTYEFGKFGIIKESDFHSKQRDFEVWMAEVKKIPGFAGPKWEVMKYFKEFCEDYNTATMPHIKYYNYEKWEMEEYLKNKDKAVAKGGAISDEARHLEEMKLKKEEKKREELAMIRGSMNKAKIDEMKQQARLKQEMTLAYRTGDDEKRKKLQKRLAPDDIRNATGGSSHPWSK